MERRKKRLIRPDVQLRVIFIALCVASLVLLINFQFTLASLWSLSGQANADPNLAYAMDQLRAAIIGKFLITVGIAIPLAVVVGVLYSFRFAGPVYRFSRYFGDIKTGRWDRPCSLRKGDDLQDVCESINEALDGMRECLQEGQSLRDETMALLQEGALRTDDAHGESVEALKARMTALSSHHAERFPDDETPSPGDDALPSATHEEASKEPAPLQPQA